MLNNFFAVLVILIVYTISSHRRKCFLVYQRTPAHLSTNCWPKWKKSMEVPNKCKVCLYHRTYDLIFSSIVYYCCAVFKFIVVCCRSFICFYLHLVVFQGSFFFFFFFVVVTIGSYLVDLGFFPTISRYTFHYTLNPLPPTLFEIYACSTFR